MQNQKGFTIIELIVTIAIIAVLAVIVSVSVMSYLNRSKDASIKADMSNLISKGTVYFDSHGEYGGFCGNVSATFNAINKIFGGVGSTSCTIKYPGNSAWCVCAKLANNSGNFYCADSRGRKTEGNNNCLSNNSGNTCQATNVAACNY